jgi:hypothetical protein
MCAYRNNQKNLVDFRFSFACLWAMWADPNEGLALKYVTFETYVISRPARMHARVRLIHGVGS